MTQLVTDPTSVMKSLKYQAYRVQSVSGLTGVVHSNSTGADAPAPGASSPDCPSLSFLMSFITN